MGTGRQTFLNRDFQLLWIGQALSDVGSQSSAVAYTLLVLALTGSPSKAGIVGLAKWLPLAVFAIPAGALADRLNRKHLMIGSDAIRLVGAASIVLALVLGRPSYPQILVVAFLDGALDITSGIAERGALRQVVELDQLQDAVARNEARANAAGLIGPTLGGLFFSIARLVPFAFDCGSFLCSTIATAATRADFQVRNEETQPGPWRELHRDMLDGFAWLRGQPFYRTAAALFAFTNPLFAGLSLLVILLARHHHASSGAIGVMLTIMGISGLLGAIYAGPMRRRFSARELIMGGPWVAVLTLPLLLVVHNPLLIGVVAGAAGFTAPAVNSVVAGSRMAVAPDALQGRIQAVSTATAMSLIWLGPPLTGLLFERLGPASTTIIVTGWALLIALCSTFAPAIRHHEPAPSRPSPAAPPPAAAQEM
jgi:predicted MFS family arabinose efflux permease